MTFKKSVFAGGATGRENLRTVESMLTNYQEFVNVMEADAARIMQGAAEIVLEHTREFVPEETGALRASGKAIADRTSRGPVGRVSFGGDTPVAGKNSPDGVVRYAHVVHEDADGRGYHFMWSGLSSAQEEVSAYIQTQLRKAASKGTRRRRRK